MTTLLFFAICSMSRQNVEEMAMAVCWGHCRIEIGKFGRLVVDFWSLLCCSSWSVNFFPILVALVFLPFRFAGRRDL